MTPDSVWTVLTPLLPIVVTGSFAIALAIINHRISQIHVMVNSRLSELVAATSRAEHAEGVALGSAGVAEIKIMIDEAIAKATAIPPTVSPEVLATALSDRAAVVAVALTDTAKDVAAELEHLTKP